MPHGNDDRVASVFLESRQSQWLSVVVASTSPLLTAQVQLRISGVHAQIAQR